MTSLTNSQREYLTKLMDECEPVLREEIRDGLRRMRVEGYDELLSGTSDAGDESLASLVTDLNNADTKRDAVELQDIFAARARMADGTYGICIDCDVAIPYERLEAYPTAKRCLACQQVHEAKRTQR